MFGVGLVGSCGSGDNTGVKIAVCGWVRVLQGQLAWGPHRQQLPAEC